MYPLAIPTQRTSKNQPELRPRRRDFNGEKAAGTCFTVLTIVIFGMIVGIGAYSVLCLIPNLQRDQTPEWRRAHSSLNLVNSVKEEVSTAIDMIWALQIPVGERGQAQRDRVHALRVKGSRSGRLRLHQERA